MESPVEFSMFEGFMNPTLPKTNISPENRPSEKEISIPTIHFQGAFAVSFMNPKSNRLPFVQSLAGIGWAPEMLALPGGGGRKDRIMSNCWCESVGVTWGS